MNKAELIEIAADSADIAKQPLVKSSTVLLLLL